MWKARAKRILLVAFRTLIKHASKEIRELVLSVFKEKILPMMAELEAKAKATPNPWDDVLVAGIKGLLEEE